MGATFDFLLAGASVVGCGVLFARDGGVDWLMKIDWWRLGFF
jgi:hypothetical protein